MKKVLNLSFLILLFLSSCNTSTTSNPIDIYSKYKNSVVLIYSEYYYRVTLDNGIVYYFTFRNGEPEIFNSEIEAINNPVASTGTGFFISKKGEIATNRHVVEHNERKQELYSKMRGLKRFYANSIDVLKKEKEDIKDFYNENLTTLNFNEKEMLENKYEEKINEINDLNFLISFEPNNSKVETVVIYMGIAYPGDTPNSIKDFHKCNTLKISDDEQVDLAIIQLETKKTPISIHNYFSINQLNNYKLNPKINDNISIIGYNQGFNLAVTENGIKSQFTEGKITQEPQSKKMLYSIPILGGSSGSPVIDNNGNIVAVNYAMSTGGQSFNFGVPINNLLKLYYGDNIPKINTLASFSDDKVRFAYKFKNYFNNK